MDNDRSQETLMALSDVDDPMKPFRDLFAAQRKALAGDPDDVYCVETQPF